MSKLRGYEFFREALGGARFVVAPMVNQSELPFRLLCRELLLPPDAAASAGVGGVGAAGGGIICYTPMLHSRGYLRDHKVRMKDFPACEDYDAEDGVLHGSVVREGVADVDTDTDAEAVQAINDRPLVVQFCGHDPETMVAAGKLVQHRCDAVDINLGCPQGIARKGRYGAFLLEDEHTVASIVAAMHAELDVPVTCKVRLLPTWERTVEVCDAIVDAGCQMLCVHGRTKEENKQLVRECNWEWIRRLKERYRDRIPVLANGGISNYEDAIRCLEYTGVDAVMSSEAILENPALFLSPEQVDAYRAAHGPRSLWPCAIALRYLHWAARYPPSFNMVRAHVMKFLHRHLVGRADLRDMVLAARTIPHMRQAVLTVRVAIDEENMTDEEEAALPRWYDRHRSEPEFAELRERALLLGAQAMQVLQEQQAETNQAENDGLTDAKEEEEAEDLGLDGMEDGVLCDIFGCEDSDDGGVAVADPPSPPPPEPQQQPQQQRAAP